MEFIKILTAIPIIQFLIVQILTFFCYALKLENNYFLITFFQQTIAVFLLTYYFYEIKGNRLYLTKKDFYIDDKKNIFLFAILGLTMQLAASLINFPAILWLSKLGFYSSGDIPIETPFDFFSAVISFCLLPAVFEEVLFRKFIFSDLKIFSKKSAIVFSAIFFAFSHTNFYSLIAVLFIGVALGMLRSKEYPLIYLMICHFCVNFAGIIINILLKTDFFNRYYYYFTAFSVILMAYIFKKLMNKPEQLEFNYYRKPELQFLSVISHIPYIYVYVIIFILIGTKNLF